MFCVKCGQNVSNENKFCSECGSTIAKPDKTDAPATLVSDESVPKLLEYLRDIIHCETAIIGYKSILQENFATVIKLCKPHELPTPPLAPLQPMYKNPLVIGKLVIAILVFVLLIALYAPPAVLAGGIVYIAVQIIAVLRRTHVAKELYAEEIAIYNQLLDKYEIQMEYYQHLADEELIRLHTESIQMELLEEQSERIDELIVHAKNALSTLYSANILHKKYQNFVAVASIYDYLSSGRTYTLVRANDDPGAYNIYEDDLRVGRIINTVGMVGAQIVNAVQSLAKDMRSMNATICGAIAKASEAQKAYASEIITGINSLNHEAELNRFNTEISNNHLEKIAEYNRIQAHSKRDWSPWGRRVVDKSGWPVD